MKLPLRTPLDIGQEEVDVNGPRLLHHSEGTPASLQPNQPRWILLRHTVNLRLRKSLPPQSRIERGQPIRMQWISRLPHIARKNAVVHPNVTNSLRIVPKVVLLPGPN